VLVDGEGKTLYIFVPDAHHKVTCQGSCAQIWPPLTLASGEKRALSSGQTQPRLLGSDQGPEGGMVVTYAGWPLYTYVSDTSPGLASGQAEDLDGGFWYVISPTGKAIRTRAPTRKASSARLPPSPGGAYTKFRAQRP
jgi:predicted lipoprotein with Yx(FWY)xxD motif